jgi:hypothetical protein
VCNKKNIFFWLPDLWIWKWILHGMMGELKHFPPIILSLTFPPVDLIRFFNPKFGFCWLRSYYKKAYKVGHHWKLVHGGEYSLKRRGSLGHNIRNIQIYTKVNNCQILVKCSWLVWRGVSSRPRDSSETFRIYRQTRWASRPKSRSQILDVDSLALYRRRIPNRTFTS